MVIPRPGLSHFMALDTSPEYFENCVGPRHSAYAAMLRYCSGYEGIYYLVLTIAYVCE